MEFNLKLLYQRIMDTKYIPMYHRYHCIIDIEIISYLKLLYHSIIDTVDVSCIPLYHKYQRIRDTNLS